VLFCLLCVFFCVPRGVKQKKRKKVWANLILPPIKKFFNF